MTNYPPPAAAEAVGEKKGRRWLVALITGGVSMLALIIGLGVGAVVGPDVESAPEYRKLATANQDLASELTTAEDQRSDLDGQLSDSEARVASLEDEKTELVGDIPEREEAVTNKEKRLDRRDKKLRRREKDVTRREKAVSKVENRIAANTFSDGLYEVGVDIEPGTYRKEAGTSGCYYAILTSSNTHDIATNNLTDGPSVMSVASGQYFETTRCGEWVLQP